MNINVSGNYALNLTPEAFILNTADIYLQCKTGSGAVNITLPRITSVEGLTNTWGFKVYINDVDNNASVNNITVACHPADKINGSNAPIVLNTNGVTGHLQVTGSSAWEFNPSAGGASAVSVYGQAYSKTNQNVNTGNPVVWANLQNSSGLTLNTPTNTKVKVSTSGKYQIKWLVEIFSQNTQP